MASTRSLHADNKRVERLTPRMHLNLEFGVGEFDLGDESVTASLSFESSPTTTVMISCSSVTNALATPAAAAIALASTRCAAVSSRLSFNKDVCSL